MKHRGQDYYEFAKVLYRDDDTPDIVLQIW